MSHPMRSYAVINFHYPVICHLIQWEYSNDMVSDDVDSVSKVRFVDTQVCKKHSVELLCMGELVITAMMFR